MACEKLYLLKQRAEITWLVFFGASYPGGDIKGMQNNRAHKQTTHVQGRAHMHAAYCSLHRKKSNQENHRCTRCIEYSSKLIPASWPSIRAKRASRDVDASIISPLFPAHIFEPDISNEVTWSGIFSFFLVQMYIFIYYIYIIIIRSNKFNNRKA